MRPTHSKAVIVLQIRHHERERTFSSLPHRRLIQEHVILSDSDLEDALSFQLGPYQ